MVIRLREPPDWSLAIMPMVAGGKPVGIVEVAAPDGSLRERLGDIERTVHGLGVGLRLSVERFELGRAVDGLGAALGGVDALLRSRGAGEAVKAAIGMIFSFLHRPIVGVAFDPKGGLAQVVAIRGLESSRRVAVRRFVDRYSVSPRFGRGERIRLANGVASAAGMRAVHLALAGSVVLITAPPDHLPDHQFIDRVAALLASSLERLGEVERATQRNEQLDLSIAWTAHELRAPLLDTTIVLEQVSTRSADRPDAELLRRARDELAGTAGLIGPLLRWASGRGTLRRRSLDLVHLVHEAVAMSGADARDRVRVTGVDELQVRADPAHLRTAIVNVIRNAAAFAPDGTTVDISVSDVDEAGCVTVRDRGPGIPAGDRESIFDPFTRGRAQTRGHGGTGLGLFIARRILEAHDGAVRLLPSRRGAEFRVEVPLATERRRASAS